jgi:hypothetical protein
MVIKWHHFLDQIHPPSAVTVKKIVTELQPPPNDLLTIKVLPTHKQFETLWKLIMGW